MKCDNCGFITNPGDQKCIKCGARINPMNVVMPGIEVNNENIKNTPKKTNYLLIIIISGIIVLAIIVFLVIKFILKR